MNKLSLESTKLKKVSLTRMNIHQPKDMKNFSWHNFFPLSFVFFYTGLLLLGSSLHNRLEWLSESQFLAGPTNQPNGADSRLLPSLSLESPDRQRDGFRAVRQKTRGGKTGQNLTHYRKQEKKRGSPRSWTDAPLVAAQDGFLLCLLNTARNVFESIILVFF